MTSAQVVETSVTVTDNSPFQDYPYPDDHTTQSTVTPGFKPFTDNDNDNNNNNNNIYPGSPLAYGIFSGALQILIYKKYKIKTESLSNMKKFKS